MLQTAYDGTTIDIFGNAVLSRMIQSCPVRLPAPFVRLRDPLKSFQLLNLLAESVFYLQHGLSNGSSQATSR